MQRYYFLTEDYNRFNEHLNKITQMIRVIADKAGNIDNSDNDPYHEDFVYTEKHRSQFKWSRRLMELIYIRDNAKIVTPAKQTTQKTIMPGTRVIYRVCETAVENNILMGSYFNFCIKGCVPCGTPIARKLIGKKKGDICEVTICRAKKQIEVVDIRVEYQPRL